MKITILTLFPEFFERFLLSSIIGRAISKKLVEIKVVNIRDFSIDKNHRVDDRSLGGGAGLIMRLEPLLGALKSVSSSSSHKVLLSASGVPYKQSKARSLASEDDLILICGHYEGVDSRFESYVDEALSIGDFVMTGGEIGAMAIADSVIRLLDGAISPGSTEEESFDGDLLEYPQYTYPLEYEGAAVPEILLTGNHEAVAHFRHREAIKKTQMVRPDLLQRREWTKEELKILKEIESGEESKLEKTAKEKGGRFVKRESPAKE